MRQAYVELMGGASATSQTTPRMEIQGPEDLSAIPHNNAILRTLALVENKALLLQQAQQFLFAPYKGVADPANQAQLTARSY
ncbi:hypothetical protein JO83_01695 [Avibacterium paragallinarum]|nr:hypothetical protein JO83_01695 [Avibacterium paragallinarum]